MKEQEQVSLFQAIAECMEMDEADVIDNNDGETVTIFDTIYQIIDFDSPRRLGDKTYYWAMFEIDP